MKLDTAFLKGRLLDHAVATAAGYEFSENQEYAVPVWKKCPLNEAKEVIFDFKSKDFLAEFTEEFKISTRFRFDDIWDAYATVQSPAHIPPEKRNQFHQFSGSGESSAEAALRCYLNATIGRSIDIADDIVELLKGDQELVDPDDCIKPTLKQKGM